MNIRKHAALLLLPRKFRVVLMFVSITIPGFAQVPVMNSFASARATIYLDFDGQTVKGTGWNWDGDIVAKPSALTTTQITEIFNRVAEDFRIFNLNITTSSAVYLNAPISKRMRLIITPTHQWYGHAGGVAFVNSFTWGDDTPAWVFTTLLDNNIKYIAEASSHEIGHTLGLQHQSTYNRNCELMTEYAEGRGVGEIGWAPIMGVGYYKNYTTWTYGTSIEGCKVMQNDISIISKGFNQVGLRTDDFGNTRTTAKPLAISNNKFGTTGLINDAADKDIFRVQLVRKSRITVKAFPASLGGNNSGANMDVLLTLIRTTGDTLLKVNPKLSLSASIDTLLNAGTYYLGVDGVKNQHVSDYGSVGLYGISGVVAPTGTTATVVIRGSVRQNMHMLNWNEEEKESVTRSYLEYSFNGIHYLPITTAPLGTNNYTNKPLVNGNVYYRLRMVLPDETEYYSNSILLSNGPVKPLSTVVKDQIQLSSPGEYEYQLFDEIGRLYQKGKLVEGLNTVPVSTTRSGILIIKVFNAHEHYTFKLLKQ